MGSAVMTAVLLAVGLVVGMRVLVRSRASRLLEP
jgi:hypothetical protein